MIKTKGYRGTAARLGICVAGAMGLAAGSYGDNAQVSAEKYEMQIFLDSTGGKEIVSGDFSAAIEILRGTRSLDSRYARSTNLCVALTLEREFSGAEEHCRSARNYSTRSIGASLGRAGIGLGKKDKLVLALNNLGVFYALSGNAQEARGYLEIAEGKGGRYSETSQRNMRALDERVETVAVR